METPVAGTSTSNGMDQEGKRKKIPKAIFTPGLIGPSKKRDKVIRKVKKASVVDRAEKETPEVKKNLQKITKRMVAKVDNQECFDNFMNAVKENLETEIGQPVPKVLTTTDSEIQTENAKLKAPLLTCNKCSKLRGQKHQLKNTAIALKDENIKLLAENMQLKSELEFTKNAQEGRVLAEIADLKKTVASQHKSNNQNETSDTILYAGVRINIDYYYQALSAETISARVRKIAAGYWPDNKMIFVAARKPPGIKRKDFIKISRKDYENIDSVVQKIQENPKLRIKDVDEDVYNLNFNVWVQKAVSWRREELSKQNKESKESPEEEGSDEEESHEDECTKGGESNGEDRREIEELESTDAEE